MIKTKLKRGLFNNGIETVRCLKLLHRHSCLTTYQKTSEDIQFVMPIRNYVKLPSRWQMLKMLLKGWNWTRKVLHYCSINEDLLHLLGFGHTLKNFAETSYTNANGSVKLSTQEDLTSTDKSEADDAIKSGNTFSLASSLSLNISTCELLPVKVVQILLPWPFLSSIPLTRIIKQTKALV